MKEVIKEFTEEKMKYLRLLAQRFPSEQSVCTEIVNLTAILNLPKGTEHFMSDIHGEYGAFKHILNNCSGVIREKVLLALGDELAEREVNDMCTLIYYPKERLELLEHRGTLSYDWYAETLTRLIKIARTESSKYTRSKVRKMMDSDFAYIIDELLHAVPDEDDNQVRYHEKILDTIIRIRNGDAFIIALSELIKKLAIDRLHLVGDIYDRGPKADHIMDLLMQMPRLDIQWGNHDLLWIGAACGSYACIANVIRNNIRYDNLRILESGYGISLRKLATFAEKHYTGNVIEASVKAINILTLKLEGEAILNNPEWEMDDRLMFNKVNFREHTVRIGNEDVKLNTDEFPTVNPRNPYRLSREELEVMKDLAYSFTHSARLKQHMDFMLKNGSMYLIYNNNLMFHGCVPMDSDGSWYSVKLGGRSYQGKLLMNICEKKVREVYGGERSRENLDFMWYMWGGAHSPACGRILKTWERTLIDDEFWWKEPEDPYYVYCRKEETCVRILEDFGIDEKVSHIINGHTPIRVTRGESPIKAGGKLIVIDGGFCKAYHKKTGIAGYTLVYSSHGMAIKAHGAFTDIHSAITKQADILSTTDLFEPEKERVLVCGSDVGDEINSTLQDLEELLWAYRTGMIR